MKIQYEQKQKTIAFVHIAIGKFFRVNNNIFLKVNPADIQTETFNAFNITTNQKHIFAAIEQVTPMELTDNLPLKDTSPEDVFSGKYLQQPSPRYTPTQTTFEDICTGEFFKMQTGQILLKISGHATIANAFEPKTNILHQIHDNAPVTKMYQQSSVTVSEIPE